MKTLGLFLVLASIPAMPQAALAPVGVQQFFDNTGVPLSGGTVTTYIAGTTTKLATYTDATGTIPASNPIVLDAGGFASIWLGSGSYKFVVKRADGTLVSTTDNISASNAELISSSNTWTQPQNFKQTNFSRFADQYPGADASIKINACIADVISAGGGTCDARGLFGTQTISQQINVGDGTHGVVLILPAVAEWDTNITDGTSCAIKQFGGTSILGQNSLLGRMIIAPATSAANLDSLYCTDASPNGGGYYKAEGFQVYDRPGATFTTAVMNIKDVFDNSQWANIHCALGNGSGKTCIQIMGGGYGSTLRNVTVEINQFGRGIWFRSNGTSKYNRQWGLVGVSVNHPQAGYAAVEISGGAANFYNNIGITFTDYHTELGTNGGATCLKVADAISVHISGMTCGNSQAGTGYFGIDLSETVAGTLRDFSVDGFQWSAGGSNNPLLNHITGETYSGTTTTQFPHYSYAGTTGALPAAKPFTMTDGEFLMRDGSGNTLHDLSSAGATLATPLFVVPVPASNGVKTEIRAQDLGSGVPRVAIEAWGAAGSTAEIAFCRANSGPTSCKVNFYKGDGTTTLISSVDATGKATFNGGMQPAATGGTITWFQKATHAAVDLASVATAACSAETTETITGVALGDHCSVDAGTALEAGGFLVCKATATDTAKWQFCNLSGVAIDRASDTYTIRVTR